MNWKFLMTSLKQKNAQYELNRAKISTLLSKELDKYEYLAGKNLE